MSLRDKNKIKRRKRIMQAVVDIVIKDGVEGLTTASIASMAEVSVATLYNLIGTLDDIIGNLISEQTAAFQLSLKDLPEDGPPHLVFDSYINAICGILSQDESHIKAALKTIFYMSIAKGRSELSAAVGLHTRDILSDTIQKCQQSGYIKKAVNTDILAEQMLYAQLILLESWSADVICLERFRLSCSLHFWSLIGAWADGLLVKEAELILLERQADILALDAERRRMRKSNEAVLSKMITLKPTLKNNS